MRVGVDEAGKGPVLGSMFAAAVRVPRVDVLPDGIRDSKELPPPRREELAAALRADDRVAVATSEITRGRIDEPGTDMTTLTVDAHADALGAVAEDGDVALVDASDVDAERFARRVASRAAVDASIIGKHGADAADPVVAAASIVAKVARDAHVSELAADYGEVGSGYPSDPATRTFLREYVRTHGALPPCTRRSWQTAADVLAAAAQSNLDEF